MNQIIQHTRTKMFIIKLYIQIVPRDSISIHTNIKKAIAEKK